MVKSGLEFFILKFTEPLQSCCCPLPKKLPIRAELAWQVSRYLWRGSVNFKINSRPLFTIIFKLKNVNFRTRDFSPLIPRVLGGVSSNSILQSPNWIMLKIKRICTMSCQVTRLWLVTWNLCITCDFQKPTHSIFTTHEDEIGHYFLSSKWFQKNIIIVALFTGAIYDCPQCIFAPLKVAIESRRMCFFLCQAHLEKSMDKNF